MKYTILEKLFLDQKSETMEVRVENSGRYFAPDENPDQPIKDFKLVLAANRVDPFFIKLKQLLDQSQKRPTFTTIKAKVEIFLPFKTGKIDVKLREMDGTLASDDPILEEIRKFVMGLLLEPK